MPTAADGAGSTASPKISNARISALRAVRYWSATDGRWLPMVDDAAALRGPEEGARRPDFTVAEMKGGGDLYFSQSDNRSSGEVVYRLRVPEGGPERVTITIENASPVRFLLLTLFRIAGFIFQSGLGETWSTFQLPSGNGSLAEPIVMTPGW